MKTITTKTVGSCGYKIYEQRDDDGENPSYTTMMLYNIGTTVDGEAIEPTVGNTRTFKTLNGAKRYGEKELNRMINA